MEQVTIPTPSDEQQYIVEMLATNNVVTDAVAGSGKSMTVVFMAKAYSWRRILLLTYNAKLRLEMRERCQTLGLTNIEVHTYHSFAVKYISKDCFTDAGLIKFIKKGTPIERLPFYNMIVVDEAQDMTPNLYKIVIKILAGLPEARMCVLGDRHQSIYGYAGADSRFITRATDIFPRKDPWVSAKLSTSYRITREMAAFINKCALHEERLFAVKDGILPVYINGWAGEAGTIVSRCLAAGYTPEDIFILAASVKVKENGNSRNPLIQLANYLTANDIPIFIPRADQARLDEDVLRGKVAFSSFHQVKGLERKVVIVLGFDDSYFDFFAKDERRDACPNTLYVAMTRAKERLYLFASARSPPATFLNLSRLDSFAAVSGRCRIEQRPSEFGRTLTRDKLADRFSVSVTELLTHISPDVLEECCKYFSYKVVAEVGEEIPLAWKVTQDGLVTGLCEDVSDINGTAIPAYHELKTTGKMSIAEDCETAFEDMTPSELLQITNDYITGRNKFTYRTKQITNFLWMEPEELELCTERLSDVLDNSSPCFYETYTDIIIKETATEPPRRIVGVTDVINGNTLWELKCTSSLTVEHKLQLLLYAYMRHAAGKTDDKRILFNILSGEMLELEFDPENNYEAIRLLMCRKYHKKTELTNEEFMSQLNIELTPRFLCDECTIARDAVFAARPPAPLDIDWLRELIASL